KNAQDLTTTLITGAAGFAGSHLLDLLDSGGCDIVAWHRPGGRPPRQAPRITWEAIDLLERAEVAAAIERLRPSTVYHSAGAAHERDGVGGGRASVQPFRSAAGPEFRGVGLCPADCRHRARPLAARNLGRKPRGTPRSHRRPRHRPRLPVHRRARASGTPLQC